MRYIQRKKRQGLSIGDIKATIILKLIGLLETTIIAMIYSYKNASNQPLSNITNFNPGLKL